MSPPVSVFCIAPTSLLLFLSPSILLAFCIDVNPSLHLELTKPCWIPQQRLVCRLLLLLDRQHWIFAYLGSQITISVRVLKRYETLLVGFGDLLGFVCLQQLVNSLLSEQIVLHLGG